MSYNELSQKYSRDERYKSVEKSRDRESYLSEYIAELKKKEKDARKMEKDKVRRLPYLLFLLLVVIIFNFLSSGKR